MASPVFCTLCGRRLVTTTTNVTTFDPYTGAQVVTQTQTREHFRGVLHERWTRKGTTWTRSER